MFRIALISAGKLHYLRGSENRHLSIEEANEITKSKDANSQTAIGRAGSSAYRYNRRYPQGWRLCVVLEK